MRMFRHTILMWMILMVGVCVLVMVLSGARYLRVEYLFSKSLKKLDALQLERRANMLKACKGKVTEYEGRVKINRRLMVDERHTLLYCPIAKVASTFWKKVFKASVSIGPKTRLNPFEVMKTNGHLYSLGQYPSGKAHWMLQNYTSFLFVREPYSRLLACFIDKFFTTNPLFWRIGKVIIRNYRENADNVSLSCGHNAMFPEFIKHVINTLQTKYLVDMHWMPMYMTCSPCQVQYDVIGKLETISHDLEYILEKHIGDDISFNDMESESEENRLVRNLGNIYSRNNSHVAKCMPLPEALYRYLKKQQVRGLLSKSMELPDWLIQNESVTQAEVKAYILEKYREDSDKTLRKLNRQEALVEAYSQVPMEDMMKLQELYKPDFELFGYDPQPAELFDENVRKGKVEKFYFR